MPRSPGAFHTRRLTEDQALLLLREWQRELRLRDWKLALEITNTIAPRHGQVRILEEKHCAYIKLLDPSAADETEMEPLDMEVALVHEMYHVALVPISQPNRSHLDIVQEQAIHKLSTHAVAMKRKLRTMERQKLCRIR